MPTASSPRVPEPQDIGFTWQSFAILKAGQVVIASPFYAFLPWWMPTSWIALCIATTALQYWLCTRPAFAARSAPARRHGLRWTLWMTNAASGSAAWLLYVPGNMTMQAVLNVGLLCIAVVGALRTVGDFPRTAVAVSLCVLPAGMRYLFEGHWVQQTWGFGSFMIVAALLMLARGQNRALLAQFEMRRRAEQAADAMATIGLAKARFFAAASHDLRQPVHAIGLYMQTLGQQALDAKGRHALKGIEQAWQVLGNLLNQVLDLTRIDSGAIQPEPRRVALHTLLRQLVAQYSPAAESRQIRLVLLYRRDWWLDTDALMLQRIVANLLDNAIKFSAAGAVVLLAIRHAGADRLRIQVRDAGEGIAAADQARIFEEFVQLGNSARNQAKGVGLGLSIVQRYAALLDARVVVRSAPGRGTCMTVTLPLRLEAAGPAPAVWPTAAVREGGVGEGGLADLPLLVGSVLLVEDDLQVADSMRLLLQQWGLRVHVAHDAAVARALAAQAQLALCDVRLPDGVSGLALALQLRAQGLPCLLISGETDPALRQDADRHGLPLLVKPVPAARLYAAVKDALSTV